MTTFTPPTGESPFDREVALLRELLNDFREVMDTMRRRMKQDESLAPGEAGKVLTELRNLLRTAIDTEKSFEKRRKEQEGIVNEYRLDLDDARATIGLRLARLRAASGT